MAKVGIVMGSDSDMPIMAKAADILDKLDVEYEMKIISAHREPDIFFDWAKTAEQRGIKVIIAGAGMAGTLQGTEKPVVITSRSDSADMKFYSICMAAMLA